VEVEVLPPVDTSQWSADSIDEHIATVRQMFLTSLDQDDKGRRAGNLRVVEK
jgi:putative phosphoserine phosphatase/1-acylglycerol-3-phosphate O-acyltransferase